MPLTCIAVVTGIAMLVSAAVHAQLRGHGGPVRALAVSADGTTVLSGSFDTSAILWDLAHGTAKQVLRFHDGAVNAVALLEDGRAVTAGADARIAVWTPGKTAPQAVFAGHSGPIAALAVSPDGATIASGSWDRTVRVWPLAGGEPRVLRGHAQNVNGVAYLPQGRALVSAGYDATVRIWPLAQPAAPRSVVLPTPLNAVASAPDGEIAAAGADGHLYFLSESGEGRGQVGISSLPIVALAVSRDGSRLAAASIDGRIAILDRKARRVVKSFAVPGAPVWSVAFLPDAQTLLTGAGDRAIRRWRADIGAPLDPPDSGPGAAVADTDPGARVFRACAACHALTADTGNRAGPSLHGVFGRRIATLPGYNYSAALRRLDIVWTSRTLSKLFEIGPAAYTPGTKMPEQRIGSAEERDALVKYLERATR